MALTGVTKAEKTIPCHFVLVLQQITLLSAAKTRFRDMIVRWIGAGIIIGSLHFSKVGLERLVGGVERIY